MALALETKFFQDPLAGIPPAISVSFFTIVESSFGDDANNREHCFFFVCVLQTVVMSLMGFTLVMIWSNDKEQSI